MSTEKSVTDGVIDLIDMVFPRMVSLCFLVRNPVPDLGRVVSDCRTLVERIQGPLPTGPDGNPDFRGMSYDQVAAWVGKSLRQLADYAEGTT